MKKRDVRQRAYRRCASRLERWAESLNDRAWELERKGLPEPNPRYAEIVSASILEELRPYLRSVLQRPFVKPAPPQEEDR